jgi:bifunctional non-homologous end joining protein LigD
VLDGELVSLDAEGKPDFPQLCECVLQRYSSIPLTYMVFDVLSVEGEPVVSRPYRERRRILEELRLDGVQWRVPEAFDDGEALFEAVRAEKGPFSLRRSDRRWPIVSETPE